MSERKRKNSSSSESEENYIPVRLKRKKFDSFSEMESSSKITLVEHEENLFQEIKDTKNDNLQKLQEKIKKYIQKKEICDKIRQEEELNRNKIIKEEIYNRVINFIREKIFEL